MSDYHAFSPLGTPTPGDVPVAQADGSVAWGSGGGGGNPLTKGRWVDPTTTVPIADQTGAEATPFATAQQAINSLTDSGSLFILPGASAGAAACGSKQINFIGMGATLDGNLAELGAVTGDGIPLSFQNVLVASCVNDGVLTFNGCEVTPGSVLCAGIIASETSFVFEDLAEVTTSTSDITFRNCTFDTTVETIIEVTPTALINFDEVSARSFQEGGWTVNVGTIFNIPTDLEPNIDYGDGSDGALAAGFGTVSMTRDMYYSSIAFQIGGADTIRTNGYRLHVSELLDLRGAPALAIDAFNANTTGIDAAAAVAGTGPALPTTGSLPQGTQGSNGGAGGAINNNGASGAAAGSATFAILGGGGSVGGAGGAGSGGKAGGAAGAYVPPGSDIRFPRHFELLRSYAQTMRSTFNSSGGGGGGGGPTGAGGGGGASPVSPSAIQVHARVIIRDSTTDAAAISVVGPRGGNGANGTTDGGGGGGSGGGAGTALQIVCDWLLGEARTCIAASGGVGGNGGTGAGGAVNGAGGIGGPSGTVLIGQAIQNQWTYSASVAGSAAAGTVGGAGGVLNVEL